MVPRLLLRCLISAPLHGTPSGLRSFRRMSSMAAAPLQDRSTSSLLTTVPTPPKSGTPMPTSTPTLRTNPPRTMALALSSVLRHLEIGSAAQASSQWQRNKWEHPSSRSTFTSPVRITVSTWTLLTSRLTLWAREAPLTPSSSRMVVALPRAGPQAQRS